MQPSRHTDQKLQSNSETSANAVAPLLRSIAREIVERTGANAMLQSRLESLLAEPNPGESEVGRLTASLAVHRRELRLAEKELRRLGWTRDTSRPLAFVRRKASGTVDETWELEGTGFHRALTDLPTA